MNAPACPDDLQLATLLATPPADDVRLVEHLDACPACQSRLERLAASHDLQRRIAAGLQRSSPAISPALADAMDRCGGVAPQLPAELRSNSATNFFNATTWALPPSATPTQLQPGPIQNGKLGRYEVEAEIGRGGMGVVYRAFDRGLNRPVAIKLLAPEWSDEPVARARFVREGRAAAAVASQHVVTIYSVEETPDGWPYLVMEFVDGVTLQQLLTSGHAFTVDEIVTIGSRIADGLAAAHDRGVLHRDIKPGNVLVQPGTWQVKIADFGLALAVTDERLTGSHSLVGTPEYMSPEQFSRGDYDERADLYMLGAVLYALCTGRPPFRGAKPRELANRIRHERPLPVTERNPDIPPWLSTLVLRLLEKNPDDRFTSAQEVSRALANRECRPSLPERNRTRGVKSDTWLAVATAFAVVLLAFSVWHVWSRASPGIPAGNDSESELVAEPELPLPRILVERRNGSSIEVATLPAAIAAAENGDTITLHGDGLFLTPPLLLHGRRLRIRAADGSSPRVAIDRQPSHDSASLITSDCPLSLEGLTLGVSPAAGTWDGNLVSYSGPELRLIYCRLQLATGADCIRIHSGRADLWNCDLDAGDGGCVRWSEAGLSRGSLREPTLVRGANHNNPAGHLAIHNSALAGRSAVILDWETVPPPVHLEGNSITTRQGIRMTRWAPSPEQEPRSERLTLLLRQNRFATRLALVFCPRANRGPVAISLQRPPFATWLVCHGEDNRYSRETAFLGVQPPKQAEPLAPPDWPQTLERWRELWPRDPASPNEARSEVVSEAEIARHIDFQRDSLGPGRPYDDWKNSPAGRSWAQRWDAGR